MRRDPRHVQLTNATCVVYRSKLSTWGIGSWLEKRIQASLVCSGHSVLCSSKDPAASEETLLPLLAALALGSASSFWHLLATSTFCLAFDGWYIPTGLAGSSGHAQNA